MTSALFRLALREAEGDTLVPKAAKRVTTRFFAALRMTSSGKLPLAPTDGNDMGGS